MSEMSPLEPAGAGEASVPDPLAIVLATWSSLLDRSPDMAVIKDASSVYRYANRAAGRFLGRDPREIEGLTDRELFPGETAEANLASDRRVIEERTTVVEEKLVRGAATPVWLRISKSPICSDDEEPVGVLCIGRDISEEERAVRALRESELEKKAILDSLPVGVTLLDPNARIRWANRPVAEILGRSNAEMVGKECCEVVPRQESAEGLCAGKRTLLTRSLTTDRVELRDGRLISIRAEPVHDADGEVSGAIEVFEDITESRRQEVERRARAERRRGHQNLLVAIATDPAALAGDFEKAARRITEGLAEAAETERAAIWMFQEDRSALHCVDLYERSAGRHSAGAVLAANDAPDLLRSMASARVVDAADARADPRTRELSEAYLIPLGISSLVAAGVRVVGELAGLISCEHVGSPRRWDPEIVSLVSELGDHAGQALLHRERQRDAEALEESERRLQTILDSVQAGILLVDASTHRIAEANPTALRMIGRPHDEVVGRVCHKFVCPAEEGSCPVSDLGKTVDNSERCMITPGGEKIPILKTVAPVTVGGRDYLLESFVDIRRQKETERELEERAKELAEAKRRQEILIGDTLGRERRMIDLKREVNELLARLGEHPRYVAPDRAAEVRRSETPA